MEYSLSLPGIQVETWETRQPNAKDNYLQSNLLRHQSQRLLPQRFEEHA
jgi:hypothetical protein